MGNWSDYILKLFQSTLPQRERRYVVLQLRILSKNFNPHSHERSDNICDLHDDVLDISIHTPTKGATNKTYIDSVTTMISIHTPTKGATYHAYKYTDILEFQSTLPPHSHEGSDIQSSCII